MPARLPRASMGHAVSLTPSVSVRLSQLHRYKQNEQSNFHSPYTLPSSVPYKSCVCHSYENTGGVWVFFPFWNSVAADSMRAMSAFQSLLLTTATGSLTTRPLGCTDPIRVTTTPPLSPLAATLTDLPASVANKRLTAWLSLLDATLTKKRGGGAFSANTALRQGEGKPGIPKGRSLRAYPLFPIHYPLSMLLYILSSLPLSFSHERRI